MNKGDKFTTFKELSEWHQSIMRRLLDASFPGQQGLKTQLLGSRFRLIDANQSLEITSESGIAAPVIKTIPVEAVASDEDGTPIQLVTLIYKTRSGLHA